MDEVIAWDTDSVDLSDCHGCVPSARVGARVRNSDGIVFQWTNRVSICMAILRVFAVIMCLCTVIMRLPVHGICGPLRNCWEISNIDGQ